MSYFRSMQGRLLALAMALPLMAGVMGPFTAERVGYFTFPLVIGICLALIAVGMSLDEYPSASITAIITLPLALFCYVLLVGIVALQVRGIVYVMAAGGFALLAVAAKPSLPTLARREARVSHAHHA